MKNAKNGVMSRLGRVMVSCMLAVLATGTASAGDSSATGGQ